MNEKAEELFQRIAVIAKSIDNNADTAPAYLNLTVHETLVMACHEGLRGSRQAYGNLFSQVDYLCKQRGVATADKIAIQTMRRNSNHVDALSRADLLYDLRALALFVSAIFAEGIPGNLVALLPPTNRPYDHQPRDTYRYLRCIVEQLNDKGIITAATEDAGSEETDRIHVDLSAPHLQHLLPLLHEGMQLNLLDSKRLNSGVLSPSIAVLEPDFLLDISTVATCFKEYGHHPLVFTLNRMQPRANTQATLLGNFAGRALDDIINAPKDQESGKTVYHIGDTLKTFFREKALEFSTCEGFNPERFKQDALTQVRNIEGAVEELFRTHQRPHALLEPSFVCERLGLQGRVDLMTTDMQLLVEQKSGRNMNIERTRGQHLQLEPHFVQLLLYYGVLQYNFNRKTIDSRLLYSKYVPAQGLVVVSYYQELFREAIRLRNEIVARELLIAREGFAPQLQQLTPQVLNQRGLNDFFYNQYLFPPLENTTAPLHKLTPLEHAYFCELMAFAYREQRIGKMGAQEGVTSCVADLWNMPLKEKKETGNIYTGLTITSKEKSNDTGGYDTITLNVPEQGEDFLPNFRRGDSIYLYSYRPEQQPDVRQAILFKGALISIRSNQLVVHLNDGQQNPNIIDSNRPYAIEHAGGDISASTTARGLHAFITSPKPFRQLILAERPPQSDTNRTLTRSYNPYYDDILLQAMQAQDYFLLVGPPGTGKTSLALKFLTQEELARGGTLLLTAYTNRAVDEICGMLDEAKIDFLRIGNEYTCEPKFKKYLLEKALDDTPKLEAIQKKIHQTRVIVGTTSMLQARPFVFAQKKFSLIIIDEASQILETAIIGLLSLSPCKFILIGDHKQLPAVVQQSVEESLVSNPLLNAMGINDLRISFFQRLFQLEQQAGRTAFTGMLRKQGRMHPDIARWPNQMFYDGKLDTVPLPHQSELSGAWRLRFIPSPSCSQPGVSDKVNTAEAVIAANEVKRVYDACQGKFLEQREQIDFNSQNTSSSSFSRTSILNSQFDPLKTVGIIVPYRNQIAVIRREIEKFGIPELEKITIDTVERYQGSQRDVIIYSFTVQHLYQLEFLTANTFVENGKIVDRKLNVAMTRARQQLILTGHEPTLRHNPLFANLIDYIQGLIN